MKKLLTLTIVFLFAVLSTSAVLAANSVDFPASVFQGQSFFIIQDSGGINCNPTGSAQCKIQWTSPNGTDNGFRYEGKSNPDPDNGEEWYIFNEVGNYTVEIYECSTGGNPTCNPLPDDFDTVEVLDAIDIQNESQQKGISAEFFYNAVTDTLDVQGYTVQDTSALIEWYGTGATVVDSTCTPITIDADPEFSGAFTPVTSAWTPDSYWLLVSFYSGPGCTGSESAVKAYGGEFDWLIIDYILEQLGTLSGNMTSYNDTNLSLQVNELYNITNELTIIINNLNSSVENNSVLISELQQNITTILTEITNINNILTIVQNDITNLYGNVSVLQENVTNIVVLINEVNSTVTNLTSRVETLETDVSDLQAVLEAMNHGTINLYHNDALEELYVWGEAPEGATLAVLSVETIEGVVAYSANMSPNVLNEYEFTVDISGFDLVKYNVVVSFDTDDAEVGALFDDLYLFWLEIWIEEHETWINNTQNIINNLNFSDSNTTQIIIEITQNITDINNQIVNIQNNISQLFVYNEILNASIENLTVRVETLESDVEGLWSVIYAMNHGTINLHHEGDVLYVWGEMPQGATHAVIELWDTNGTVVVALNATNDTTFMYQGEVSLVDLEPIKYNVVVRFFAEDEELYMYVVGDLFDDLYILWLFDYFENEIFILEQSINATIIDIDFVNQTLVNLTNEINNLNINVTNIAGNITLINEQLVNITIQLEEITIIIDWILDNIYGFSFVENKIFEVWQPSENFTRWVNFGFTPEESGSYQFFLEGDLSHETICYTLTGGVRNSIQVELDFPPAGDDYEVQFTAALCENETLYESNEFLISVVDLAQEGIYGLFSVFLQDVELNYLEGVYWTSNPIVLLTAALDGSTEWMNDLRCEVWAYDAPGQATLYERWDFTQLFVQVFLEGPRQEETNIYCSGDVDLEELTPIDGQYTIELCAHPIEGQVECDLASFIWDDTPPVINFIYPGESDMLRGTVTFSVNVTDDGIVQYVDISLTNKSNESQEWPLGLATLNTTTGLFDLVVDTNAVPDDYYNIVVVAEDAAGNMAEGILDPLFDNTVPVIQEVVVSGFAPTMTVDAQITDNLAGVLNSAALILRYECGMEVYDTAYEFDGPVNESEENESVICPTACEVKIYDENYTDVIPLTLVDGTSWNGTWSGDFAAEAGWFYEAAVSGTDGAGNTAELATSDAYGRPSYTVTITTEKDVYLNTETVVAEGTVIASDGSVLPADAVLVTPGDVSAPIVLDEYLADMGTFATGAYTLVATYTPDATCDDVYTASTSINVQTDPNTGSGGGGGGSYSPGGDTEQFLDPPQPTGGDTEQFVETGGDDDGEGEGGEGEEPEEEPEEPPAENLITGAATGAGFFADNWPWLLLFGGIIIMLFAAYWAIKK